MPNSLSRSRELLNHTFPNTDAERFEKAKVYALLSIAEAIMSHTDGPVNHDPVEAVNRLAEHLYPKYDPKTGDYI